MNRTCGFSNNCLLAIIPGIAAAFGLALSLVSSFWCETVKFVADVNAPDLARADTLEYGLWSQKAVQVERSTASNGEIVVTVSESCEEYGDEVFINMAWKAARAFSVIAPILGGILAAFLIFSPIGLFPSPPQWKAAGAAFLWIAGFQGCTFLIFKSTICTENWVPQLLPNVFDETCEWHDGSSANAAACGLWFLTGVMVLLIPTPARPPREPIRQQDITYDENGNEVDVKEYELDEEVVDDSSAVEYIENTVGSEEQ